MFAAITIGVALGIILLALPVEIGFRVERRDGLGGEATLGLFFGLIQLPVPLGGETKNAKAGWKKSGAKTGSRSKKAGRMGFSVLANRAFVRRLLKFVLDIFSSIKADRLRLYLRAGLADPADTGIVWGYFAPVGVVLAAIRGAVIRVEPEFSGELLEFEGEGRLAFVPLRVLGHATAFAVSPVTLKTLWSMR